MTDVIKKLGKQRSEQSHIWGHLETQRWQATTSHAGQSVLDVGCANGVYVNKLLEQNRAAIGVDLLPYDEWKNLDNRIAMADALHLPFADNSFDTIISFETLEHVPDPHIALAEYHRICRKNIVISVPNAHTPEPLQHGGFTFHHYIDRTHVNFYTLSTLQQQVESYGFKVMEVRLFNPVLPALPLLASFGISIRYARRIGKLINGLSRQKYFMSILLVANKVA